MFGEWAQKKGRKAHFYEMNETISACLRRWPDMDHWEDRDICDDIISNNNKCKECLASIQYSLWLLLFNIAGAPRVQQMIKEGKNLQVSIALTGVNLEIGYKKR